MDFLMTLSERPALGKANPDISAVGGQLPFGPFQQANIGTLSLATVFSRKFHFLLMQRAASP